MPGTPKHAIALRERIAQHRRDASFTRVSKATKAIGASSVVAVGALGLYVGKALPGHQAKTPSGSTSSTSTPPSTTVPTTSSAATSPTSPPTTITPPTSPPARASSPPVVSSGAS